MIFIKRYIIFIAYVVYGQLLGNIGSLTDLLNGLNSGSIIDIITDQIPDSIIDGTDDDYQRPTNNLEIKSDQISQFPLFSPSSCNRTGVACVSQPKHCKIHQRNCFNILIERLVTGVQITLAKSTESNDWIGIGFSADTGMANDDIYYCSKKEDGEIIMLSHYSKGRSETISANRIGIIPGTIQTYKNQTFISCSFQRDIKVTKNKVKYDLTKNSWFILAASGSYRKGVLAYHGNGGHSRSDLPFIFKKSSIVPDSSYRPPVRSTQSTTTVTTKNDFSTLFPPIFGSKETTTMQITTIQSNGNTSPRTDIFFLSLLLAFLQ